MHIAESGVLKCSYSEECLFFDHYFFASKIGITPKSNMEGDCEGKDVLKQRLIKRIGNGLDTKLWEDNWIPGDEMMRSYGCLSDNPPQLAYELVDATLAMWDVQWLGGVFLPIDTPHILGIPLFARNVPDFWA